ncbi:tRNA pseudouridine(38-40) synthase TruA [[Acholeplasma] multilocale]|uniref:tRNA pseudouridine(38-40) synthase TruA n=1 Tax=[Acholeplasma] multilocale TaxID=264638 RepID=UPI00047D5EB5|nr:tRNA pseudouridine(38-40) synthase TruA [[Acholeplasma] multilocale]
MVNLLISLSYDGTDYCGWVIQKKGKTIQGELEKALKGITKNSEYKILGASKTDSGVHALDQKVLVTIEFEPDLTRFSKALNRALPSDIIINRIEKVSEDFNIRDVKQKTYKYVINDQQTNIFNQRFELDWRYGEINIEKLQEIFNCFIGEHEFKLFSGLTTEEMQLRKTYRKVDSIVVERSSTGKVEIIFKGKGFIRYQIRMIVGAALSAYQGKRISTSDIKNKLQGIGEKSTIVIEAKGLILEKIEF